MPFHRLQLDLVSGLAIWDPRSRSAVTLCAHLVGTRLRWKKRLSPNIGIECSIKDWRALEKLNVEQVQIKGMTFTELQVWGDKILKELANHRFFLFFLSLPFQFSRYYSWLEVGQ